MSLRRAPWGIPLLLLLAFLTIPIALAQDGIKIVVNGEPDVVNGQVNTAISVNTSGGTILNLPPESFQVRENNRSIPPEELTVEPFAAGIGLVILVDRGGIAASNGCQGPTGQLRISEAKVMSTDLVNSLIIQVDGASDDMVAIVGIDDEESSGNAVFWPDQNFSYNPVDRNLALNALEPLDAPEYLLRDQTVTTPLYEGLYRALNLLTANSDPAIRSALSTRQRMILLFSDGIDRDYSDDVIESDILRIADEQNVIIHAVGLACRGGDRLVENSLRRLTANSQGTYWRHSSEEEHAAVVAGLQNLLTYRQQYKLSFPTRLSGGTNRLAIQVLTELGADEVNTQFISNLQTPQLTVAGVPNGYSISEEDAWETTLPITATVEFGDGVPRDVTVQFMVDGTPVFTTTTPPYLYEWGLDGLEVGTHTLLVTAIDSQLGETLREERVVQITAVPTPTPELVVPGPTSSTGGNLAIWSIPLLILLIILLFVLLYRTRTGFKQAVIASAQNVRSKTAKLTQVLGPPKRPLAVLTVRRGPNHGQQYRLTEDVTRFGREQDRADHIIPGPYVSALHFSIMYNPQQQAFYIMDHSSTNGTYVNRQRLPAEAYQHIVLGSVISIGQNHEVEILFEPPVGKKTVKLHSSTP